MAALNHLGELSHYERDFEQLAIKSEMSGGRIMAPIDRSKQFPMIGCDNDIRLTSSPKLIHYSGKEAIEEFYGFNLISKIFFRIFRVDIMVTSSEIIWAVRVHRQDSHEDRTVLFHHHDFFDISYDFRRGRKMARPKAINMDNKTVVDEFFEISHRFEVPEITSESAGQVRI